MAPPPGAWAGEMRWCDLAFLHWPVEPGALQPFMPPGVQVDVYDGRGWIGVVPFRMEGVRLRRCPPVPSAHAFAEINVRTYVRAGGRAGVWFFSLDAASRLAVRGARWAFNLPYFDAAIRVGRQDDVVVYESRRVHRRAPAARFSGDYRAVSAAFEPTPETLEHFLVERYCLFTYDRWRGLGRIDVDHEPWRLQHGAATVRQNTMVEAAGLTLPLAPPLVHVAADIHVRAWHRQPVVTDASDARDVRGA